MNNINEKHYEELIESFHKCSVRCNECLCRNNEENIDYCFLFSMLKGQLTKEITKTIDKF